MKKNTYIVGGIVILSLIDVLVVAMNVSGWDKVTAALIASVFAFYGGRVRVRRKVSTVAAQIRARRSRRYEE